MSLRPKLIALLAAVAACAAPAVAETPKTQTILPGYWEYTNTVSFLITQTKVERRCVKPAEIDRFFSGPRNHHYTCTYPTRIVGGGRAEFDGTCVDKKGRTVAVTASGTYAPTHFKLNARIKANLGGVPIAPSAVMEARRIGDVCPAEG